MNDVAEIMLARFMTLYGEPKTNDIDAYMAEYVRALRGMSRQVLQGGTDRLVKSHKHRNWPTIGEAYDACQRAADELSQKQTARERNVPYVPSRRAPYSAEMEASWERARIWRQEMVDQYGSVDAALRAHARINNQGGMASKKSTFKPIDTALGDVSRPAFEAMQKNSPNKELHTDKRLTERSRRMTGDDA